MVSMRKPSASVSSIQRAYDVDHRLLDVAAGGVDVLQAAREVAGEELLGVVELKVRPLRL
jgi:hypothetical protein